MEIEFDEYDFVPSRTQVAPEYLMRAVAFCWAFGTRAIVELGCVGLLFLFLLVVCMSLSVVMDWTYVVQFSGRAIALLWKFFLFLLY